MEFEVRTAMLSDATAIVEVLRRSIQQLCFLDHQHDQSKMQQWLQNKTVENISVWVAAKNSSSIVVTFEQRVIAMGLIDAHNIIQLCYVDPDYSHKGVGGLLLRELLLIAESHDHATVLLTSTKTALDFYQHFGFTIQKHCTDCYGLVGYEMLKKL